MGGKTLTDLVRSGTLTNLALLKAEFRRRSLQVHPDTSGLPGAAFVALQKDFDGAEAWLDPPDKPSFPAPTPTRFDLRGFCWLLKETRAKGIPSPALARRPVQRALIGRVIALATLAAPGLAASASAYLTGATPASEPFDQALANFTDAVCLHDRIHPRAATMIRSYLDEVKEPGLRAFVDWVRTRLE